MSKIFLEKIVQLVGGQLALAEKLSIENKSIKQAHVWGWLNKTKLGVPAEQVLNLCKSVDWKVTPHQLRPDIYPHPDDGLPDHMRSAA